MAEYTLSYSAEEKGWPSFYSFIPDFMIGMNQHFYSFKSGQLWRHDTNATRNNFYGTQYTSTIQTVFNAKPLENKLFKTINIEGTHKWGVVLISDLQNTGFINEEWFIKKEASWFSFLRNSGETPASQPEEYPLRSLNGIGTPSTYDVTVPAAVIITFPIAINLQGILSVGDILYQSFDPYTSATLIGEITEVQSDKPNGVNQLIVDTTIPSGNLPSVDINSYLFYIKSAVAESHGILGHYGIATFTLTETVESELFAVESEVMKSYP